MASTGLSRKRTQTKRLHTHGRASGKYTSAQRAAGSCFGTWRAEAKSAGVACRELRGDDVVYKGRGAGVEFVDVRFDQRLLVLRGRCNAGPLVHGRVQLLAPPPCHVGRLHFLPYPQPLPVRIQARLEALPLQQLLERRYLALLSLNDLFLLKQRSPVQFQGLVSSRLSVALKVIAGTEAQLI